MKLAATGQGITILIRMGHCITAFCDVSRDFPELGRLRLTLLIGYSEQPDHNMMIIQNVLVP